MVTFRLAVHRSGILAKAVSPLHDSMADTARVFSAVASGFCAYTNGHVIQGALLPKYYLDQIVPIVFEAFYSTDHFQIGALLPLAICRVMDCCRSWIVTRKSAPSLGLILIAMLAASTIELHRVKSCPRRVRLHTLIGWWRKMSRIYRSDQPADEPRILEDLYFSPDMAGFSQVEGLATRTPPRSYAYIDTNYVFCYMARQCQHGMYRC